MSFDIEDLKAPPLSCVKDKCVQRNGVCQESIFVTCTVYESIDGPQGGAARV